MLLDDLARPGIATTYLLNMASSIDTRSAIVLIFLRDYYERATTLKRHDFTRSKSSHSV
jgi:hypothetical protein